MSCRTFFADVLPDLELAELTNDGWTNDHAHEQRGKAGKRCPKRDVTKNTERRKEGVQPLIEQPIKQSSSEKWHPKMTLITGSQAGAWIVHQTFWAETTLSS
jgi:hypothetical protein